MTGSHDYQPEMTAIKCYDEVKAQSLWSCHLLTHTDSGHAQPFAATFPEVNTGHSAQEVKGLMPQLGTESLDIS